MSIVSFLGWSTNTHNKRTSSCSPKRTKTHPSSNLNGTDFYRNISWISESNEPREAHFTVLRQELRFAFNDLPTHSSLTTGPELS
jgi:hypothetical protein